MCLGGGPGGLGTWPPSLPPPEGSWLRPFPTLTNAPVKAGRRGQGNAFPGSPPWGRQHQEQERNTAALNVYSKEFYIVGTLGVQINMATPWQVNAFNVTPCLPQTVVTGIRTEAKMSGSPCFQHFTDSLHDLGQAT